MPAAEGGLAAAKRPKRGGGDSKAAKPLKRKSASFWEGVEGWKSVDTGDELLLGAEEGGFAGLEILENPPIFDTAMQEPSGEPGHERDTGGSDADDVAALKARLSALEQENAQLKQQGKRKAPEAKQGGGQQLQSQGTKQRPAKKQKAGGSPAQQQGKACAEVQADPHGATTGNTAAGAPEVGTSAAAAAAAAEDAEATTGGTALSKRQQNKQRALELRRAKKERKQAALLKRAAATSTGGSASDGTASAAATASGAAASAAAAVAVPAKQKSRPAGAAAGADTTSGAGSKRAAAAATVVAGGKGSSEDVGQPLADISAWKVFSLQPDIERALALMGFSQPSEIQKACLPAAINDRQDIIGAAQTGSGKTLAFGLPIMQVLLQERELLEASGVEDPNANKLRALILTPTRELALQVCKHLQAVGKVCKVRVVAIVGGLAQVKQSRQLASCPQVVVATPGRLWELIRDRQPHLADFSHLSFLVLDEADRMVQQGHFQELHHILDLVPRQGAGREETYDKDFEEAFKQDTQRGGEGPAGARTRKGNRRPAGEEEEEEGDAARQRCDGDVEAGPGADQGEGEEAVEEEMEEEEEAGVLLSDGEEQADAGDEGEGEEGEQEVEAGAAGPSQNDQQQQRQQRKLDRAGRQQQKQQRQAGHLLQTFVFSATLTLPMELRRRLRREGGGAGGGASFQSLMDRVPFRGEPKVVDLTTERCVANRLVEASVSCTEDERDEVLYYLLARHPGRTLVFVNAVSAVRRLSAILKVLGLPAHALHAQQQQRQRLKAVDRFKEHPQAILVATDVAARGLDIKDVRCVVHYQLPASADTYVHRSGRTARAGQDGLSIALITPKDAPRWVALGRLLHKTGAPPSFPVDRTVMPEVHKRVMLALKVDELQRTQRKQQADKSWAKTHAELLGVDLDGMDDDEQAEEQETGGKSSSSVKALQAQLAQLLSAPLIPKMSTRYFTGGAAAAVAHGAGLQATGADNHAIVPLDTVNQAVAHANRLQQSKDSVTAQQAVKKKRRQQQQQQPQEAGGSATGAATAGMTAGDGNADAGTSGSKQALQGAGPQLGASEKGEAKGRKQARKSGVSQAGTAKAGKHLNGPKGGKQIMGGKGVKKVQQPAKWLSQAELARMAVSNNEARRKNGGGAGRRKMVVIPAAFGREAQGADALEALRKKLALLG